MHNFLYERRVTPFCCTCFFKNVRAEHLCKLENLCQIGLSHYSLILRLKFTHRVKREM